MWRNTKTPVDALALADAILQSEPIEIDGSTSLSSSVSPLIVDNIKRGEMLNVSWSSLREGQWYTCSFAQTDLVRTAHFLRQGKINFPVESVFKDIPIVPLKEVGELGA